MEGMCAGWYGSQVLGRYGRQRQVFVLEWETCFRLIRKACVRLVGKAGVQADQEARCQSSMETGIRLETVKVKHYQPVVMTDSPVAGPARARVWQGGRSMA
jgi:hypothetical protein